MKLYLFWTCKVKVSVNIISKKQNLKNITYWHIPDPMSQSLTNNMSGEIVLKLNIKVILLPMLIDKHSFEVVREKARVGGQVKLKMSEEVEE